MSCKTNSEESDSKEFENEIQYTVYHYQQNIDNDNYTLVKSDTQVLIGKINQQTNAIAKSYNGFTAQSFSQEKILADGTTVIKIYYNRNIITLTFDVLDGIWANDGTTAKKKLSGKYGASVNYSLGLPDKANCIKIGWDKDVQKVFERDETYTACYTFSDEAHYTVKHYQQNIEDDNYTLVDSDTQILIGETNGNTKAIPNSYTGFSVYSITQKTISGDETTVVEIYYNRNIYKIIFKANEGVWGDKTTEDKVFNLKYGFKITNLSIPTVNKTGYICDWNITSSMIVTQDETFIAQWMEDCRIFANKLDNVNFNDIIYTKNKLIKLVDEWTSQDLINLGNKLRDYDNWYTLDMSEASGIEEIPYGAFNSKSENFSITLKKVPINNIILPDTVKTIRRYAFYGTKIQSINLPSSIDKIEEYAFQESTIRKVEIPEGVSIINYGIFLKCTQLFEVILPSSIIEIKGDAFANCSNLQSIDIPEGCKSIENRAFAGCSSLKSANIPSTVEKLGTSVFRDCSELSSEMTINNKIAEIPGYLFSGCTKLTKVNLPNTIVEIGGSAFEDCNSLEEITIPDTVESIGAYAFSKCGITEIKIPNRIAEIKRSSFAGTNIKELTIPPTVKTVALEAFRYCKNLKKVTVYKSTIIDYGAFYSCYDIDDIYYDGALEDWTSINASVFADSHDDIGYVLHLNNNDTYIMIWSTAANTIKNLSSSIENVTIVVTGIVNGERLKDIGDAIKNNTYIKNVKLDLSATKQLTNIAERTFYNCQSLTEIILPNSLISIGVEAFYNCSLLENIKIPSQVMIIQQGAFERNKLKTIQFENPNLDGWYSTAAMNFDYEKCINGELLQYLKENGKVYSNARTVISSPSNYNSNKYTNKCFFQVIK